MGRRFFFTRRTRFSLLDKRNTRDRVKGLRIVSMVSYGIKKGAEALQGTAELTQ